MVLIGMHVDVLVGASRDRAVYRCRGFDWRPQILLWQWVVGPAQDEQPTRIKGKPDLVGVCDTPVVAGRATRIPKVQGNWLIAGQKRRDAIVCYVPRTPHH